MILADLLERMDYSVEQGSIDMEVTDLIYDSRKAKAGACFVCISGAVRDAHDFAGEVAEHGVTSVIAEKDVKVPEHVTVIRVDNTRLALACMAAAWFGHPAEKLKTIGITGTKGKTTTTYMVKSILENAGFKVGLIGTIEVIIGEKKIPAANTTPESYMVQQYFKEMVDAGCDSVVMEVSSQGLMLHRVGGFVFDYGIFTNLEPDHIGPNEHKDFDDYARCKAMLFSQCRQGIFNADDSHLEKILEGHTCQVETFGMSENADLRAMNIKLLRKPGILGITYKSEGLLNLDVEIDIPGKFSVYNSLTAIAICRHFGVKEEDILKALRDIHVKGRVELVPTGADYALMIDYAHNAMSLKSLLTSLREYDPGRLICVFGCGGNRDPHRRFEMGEVSSNMADLTVVTSDNPRWEEPMAIIEDIKTGVEKGPGKYVTIPDRKEAIRYCVEHARSGDVIVVAGKGHEDYQEIEGVKYHMSDREMAEEILAGKKRP